MSKLYQKLDHLKWLKSMGIEYYCSDKKDSKNSLIQELSKLEKNKTIKHAKKTDLVKSDSINSNMISFNNISTNSTNISSTAVRSNINNKQNKQSSIISAKNANLGNVPTNIANARKLADNARTIEELRTALEGFNGCELKEFANHMVFSDGPTDAPILILGEAPGATEDEKGIPFCGDSGLMLDKMLGAINISRKTNAYITNSVFWRPPANRRPTNDEIEICKPFVEKHIALIKPKFIILVGGTAIAALLGKKVSFSDIRQNNYPYINQYLSENIPTSAIFHPAYLLRQPTQKKSTWYDLLKIREFLDLLNI